MAMQRYIETHVHMDAWDKRTKAYVKNCGVEQFWVMDTRDEIHNPFHVTQETMLKAAKDAPGVIIPFARIRWDEGAGQVAEYFKAGFVGLKAITPPLPYNDPRYFSIYEEADRFGMPILFHTGIISHSIDGKRNPAVRGYGPSNMQPAFLATIADLFPSLVIIGGHLGFPYTEQTEHNLYFYPNIYHDMSGYMPLEWFISILGRKTCGYLKGPRFFYEKILFATDHCIGNPEAEQRGVEKREATRLFFKWFASTYAWSEHVDHMFHQNARRIMDAVLAKQKRRDDRPSNKDMKKIQNRRRL